MAARTGDQFLDGLRNRQRRLWLGDQPVADVTAHPALAGAAGTLAGIFDRQHEYAGECLMPDPETGEPINISHLIPRSVDDLKRRNRGLARIAEATVGLMGRTPDYMNVKFACFASQPEVWSGLDGRNAKGAANIVEYQKFNYGTQSAAVIGVPKDHRFNISFTLAGIGTFSDLFGAFGGGLGTTRTQ